MIRITENLSHSDDNFFCSAKNIYAQLQKIIGQTTKNLGKPREKIPKKNSPSRTIITFRSAFAIKYFRTATKYILGTLQKICKKPEKTTKKDYRKSRAQSKKFRT